MKTLITATITLGFLWLSYTAMHRQEQGYAHSVFDVLDKHASKWKTKEAALIAEVWNLTPDDVAQPINIFGKE